ncbi:MAG: hypothetical protein K8F91_06840 [Candidatus Obscuribacterales bacterium]|nr:hypothetical protein [Candidatus Obscuribacterales bacterium]
MKERETLVVSGLVLLMLVLWLGFIFHEDPRFPGSFGGGILGVAATALMLVPLAYSVVKRWKALKEKIVKKVPMRTLLSWHIYAGILGPIVALAHTGHRFESALGIALTGMMLTVVISGFVGRYLMSQIAREMKEKKVLLNDAVSRYEQTLSELREHPEEVAAIQPFMGRVGRMFLQVDAVKSVVPSVGARAIGLSETIADLEFAIKTHEKFKTAFRKWLKFHIVISWIFYALMFIHIWSEFHFGLRWLV